MKFFKLSTLALASTLTLSSGFLLVGCGSDSDNKVSVQESELQQAKNIVNTARVFVSDSKAVEAAYTDVADIFTQEQEQRLSYITEIPLSLAEYMEDNNLSELDSAAISSIPFYGFTLSPNADFTAKIDAEGNFTLSGTSYVNADEDDFDITYDAFSLSINDDLEDSGELFNISFKEIKFGEPSSLPVMLDSANRDDLVVLSAVNKEDTVTGKLETSDVSEEFEIGTESSDDSILKAALSLTNLKLTANDSIIKANNFEFALLSISINNDVQPVSYASNQVINIILPYRLALEGNFKKDSPATDLAISLSTGLQPERLKAFIANVRAGNNTEETAENFIGVDLLLSIKGNVAKNDSATIPLDFQAQLERTKIDLIELKKLNATVDGKSLYVTGKTNLNEDLEVVGSELIITQSNTSITLQLDLNGDFIKDPNGKLADILVNGRDYGDLIDDGNKIVAKYSDNSFIIL